MTDTTDKTSSSKTAISSSTSSAEFNLEPCSSTSDASNSNTNGEQLDQNAIQELIQQASMSMQVGKRHMYVQDFQSAVPCFEVACEFLNKCFGLRALECAEAYLNYGISLYELSRTGEENEDNIVNVEKSGGDDEEDDEDDEEEDEEEENDEEEDVDDGKEITDKKKAEYISVTNVIVGSNKDNNLNKIDKNLMDQPSTSKGVTATSTNGVGKEKNDENEDDDNATNIEIAYEVLTTAKEIYSEHLKDKEMRLNYAEALQKLGEISIDWENADGAIEYLNECLKQRQEVLEPDDRLIAVTHHFLALAMSLKYDAETSTQALKKSLEVIQLRINNLKTKDRSTMTQFEIESTDREIQQMESLIPEINLKMEEIKEQIRVRDQSMMELEKKTQEATAFLNAKPINSISHLLKRKRNDQENGSEKETNKTIKIDPSSSASSSSSAAIAESSNVPASSGSNINPAEEEGQNREKNDSI